MRIPRNLADVDREWLNTALHGESSFPNPPLTGFSTEVIGEGIGFMGEVIRLKLAYETSHIQPSDDLLPDPQPDSRALAEPDYSLILKIPTQSDNRSIGEILGVYEREVRFYSELQPEIRVRTPASYLTQMDEGGDPEKALGLLKFFNRFPVKVIWWLFILARKIPPKERNYALLLEDLSSLRPGNQIDGCNMQDAKTALAGMAQLHAQYWNKPVADRFAWVIPLELGAKAGQAVFLDCLPRYIEANTKSLTARHLELLGWLKENAIKLFGVYNSLPSTLLHGDFRLDNIFFDDTKSEIVLCDWQTLMNGPAGLDLAYFLSASLGSDSSDDHISELIGFYREQLAGHGIEIDQKTLEWSYHAGMLIILHKVIPAEYQDMLELEGDRGHQLAVTWIERILHKLEGLDLDGVFK